MALLAIPLLLAAFLPLQADAAEAAPLDRLMLGFLEEHQVPGAALAVAKDGRLVYARGFGTVDRTTGEPVPADALFRIASISKPFTAAAVLRLVARQELSLDARLVDRLTLASEAADADPRLAAVTLRDLLQHTGGWDREVSFDPMFRATRIRAALGLDHPPRRADIARYMLPRPLDHDPGSIYAYSNFGYLLLGLVLEERCGKSYEEVVRAEVLRPLGIRDMRLGRTLREHRAPREVVYHTSRGLRPGVVDDVVGESVAGPYGAWDLECMDAHGGWLASAVDLVRFGSAIAASGEDALLDAAGRSALVARRDGGPATVGVHYGLGWSVRTLPDARGRNLWHTGSLDGTSTLLVIRHDGWCWAVLFNAREDQQGRTLAGLIDSLVHRAVDATQEWPDTDLFPGFGFE